MFEGSANCLAWQLLARRRCRSRSFRETGNMAWRLSFRNPPRGSWEPQNEILSCDRSKIHISTVNRIVISKIFGWLVIFPSPYAVPTEPWGLFYKKNWKKFISSVKTLRNFITPLLLCTWHDSPLQHVRKCHERFILYLHITSYHNQCNNTKNKNSKRGEVTVHW